MKKKHWPARDPVKNYFPLPNELYSLGLSTTAIAIYGYLLRIEDRQTYQCLASYSKIGKAIGRSVNTVRKYVTELEERSLIRTERTTIITQDGRKQNGCLRYTILPIQKLPPLGAGGTTTPCKICAAIIKEETFADTVKHMITPR